MTASAGVDRETREALWRTHGVSVELQSQATERTTMVLRSLADVADALDPLAAESTAAGCLASSLERREAP